MPDPQVIETETKLQYVSPDLLDFDPTNPRFAGLLPSKKQEDIQKELFAEPYYASELVDSLVENGFIDYEPLVVKRSGSRFTVVEGNRRLAAIREIRSNPEKYSGKVSDLDSIPVLIFPETPDEQQQNEMRVYLGVRHLLGFREWPPISKAQFLERESKRPGGLDRVIKETRITRTQARRFLVPYRLLKDSGEKLPAGEDFWVLGEGLGRAGIKDFIRLEVDSNSLKVLSYDKRRFNLLLTDLYGHKKSGGERDTATKVVTDTRALSRLASVLTSEKASSVLHSGKTLDEAEIYVDTREQSIKRLLKVSKSLNALIKKVAHGDKSKESMELARSYKQFDEAVKNFAGKESQE